MTKIIIVFATLIVTALGMICYQIYNPVSNKLTPDQWASTPTYSPNGKYIAVDYISEWSRQYCTLINNLPRSSKLADVISELDPIVMPRNNVFVLNARNYSIIGRLTGYGPYWLDNDTLSCAGPGSRIYSVKGNGYLPVKRQMHYMEDNQPHIMHERVIDISTGRTAFDADSNPAHAALPRGHHIVTIEPVSSANTDQKAPASSLLRMRDLDDGQVKYTKIMNASAGMATTVDGNCLAYLDDKLRVIDTESKKEIYAVALPHQEYIKIQFAPDGKRIALTDAKHAIEFYDLPKSKLLCKIQGTKYTKISWLLDDKVTLEEGNKIGIFSLSDGKYLGGESLNAQKFPVISMNARKYFYMDSNKRVAVRDLTIDPKTQTITGWSAAHPWVQ